MKFSPIATTTFFLTRAAWSNPLAEPNTPTDRPWLPTKTSSTTHISTPTPTQEGMVTWCNEFHHVTWGSSRDCIAIASMYGISLAAFIRWNPDVGSDCGQLLLDYWYCVGRVAP